MSKKNKRRSGGSGAGAFFLGGFLGFLSCIALIVGACCFVYFKVSPSWINKTFKTNISLGNKEINSKTLSDLVSGVQGFIKNKDTYTLADLKGDFGIDIDDDLFGIDISDLKNVALPDLGEALEDKFGSISADDLRNINGMNLDSLDKILGKENTYYYNSANEKLYKNYNGTSFSSEVSFDYELNNDKSKVIVKGKEFAIVSNEVKIEIWYLPIAAGLSDFTSSMGSQITLAELEEDYGVTLPSYFKNIDKSTSINNLQNAIKDLQIADFLGYTIDNSDPDNPIVRDGDGDVVTGLMRDLALETVDGLNDIESKFSSLSAADLEETMDLSSMDKILNKKHTYYVSGDKLYNEEAHETEVEFEYSVSGWNVKVEGQTFIVTDGKVDITLRYLPLATAISNFTSNLGDNLTLKELKDDYGVVLPDYILKGNDNKTINEIDSIIDNLYVADILGYTIEGEGDNRKVYNGDDEVKGVMAIVAKEQIGSLSNIKQTIDDTKISDILNLNIKQDEDTKYYYDDQDNDGVMDDGEKVANVMKVVSETTVGGLAGLINGLKLSDIFSNEERSEGILSLITSDPTIEQIPTEIEKAVKNTSLGELIEKGVIEKPEDYDDLKDDETTILKDDNVTFKVVSELTLPEMIDYCFDLLQAAKLP